MYRHSIELSEQETGFTVRTFPVTPRVPSANMEGATSHQAVTSSDPENLVTCFKHLKLNVSRTNELSVEGTIMELL